jgi:hypothetical protein
VPFQSSKLSKAQEKSWRKMQKSTINFTENILIAHQTISLDKTMDLNTNLCRNKFTKTSFS